MKDSALVIYTLHLNNKVMKEGLIKLFARMLYDIGRGYGSPQVYNFMEYILNLDISDVEKERIVKRSIQIAIAAKASKIIKDRQELLSKIVEESFQGRMLI